MHHVADLVDEGFGDQIVLGQDVFVKAHLHRYGGNGYDHLPRRVLPTLRESYGVEQGLISSFPVRVRGGKWEIVQDLPINDFSRAKIDASLAELKEEKSLVSELL